MRYEERPIAFIAMRFADDHWRDSTYVALRKELETAGYRVLRGDELKTSAPVVEEVCRLLREAEFVVIDSSGDSHNVSYELGYCHGVGRAPEKTLLLRNNGDLPFNYQHYRHRVYRNIRHLRRITRDYLSISEPLTDEMLGYAFTFEFSNDAGVGYIMDGAECIIDAVLAAKFTGRFEIYSAERFTFPGRFFTVGAALRVKGGARGSNTPSNRKWTSILKQVSTGTSAFDGRIRVDSTHSELAVKRGMKADLLYCGAAELQEGKIVRVLDVEEEGNFFTTYLRRKAGVGQ